MSIEYAAFGCVHCPQRVDDGIDDRPALRVVAMPESSSHDAVFWLPGSSAAIASNVDPTGSAVAECGGMIP